MLNSSFQITDVTFLNKENTECIIFLSCFKDLPHIELIKKQALLDHNVYIGVRNNPKEVNEIGVGLTLEREYSIIFDNVFFKDNNGELISVDFKAKKRIA